MAPTGPKKGAGSSGPRGGGKTNPRGGVSKRRGAGATKIDRDGDLDMDAPAAGNGVSKSKRSKNSSTSDSAPRSTRSTTAGSRPSRPTAKAQQMIQRALTDGPGRQAARISSGPRGPGFTLRVEGLKSSKAAHNADGGLKDLLSFLERKAQSVGHLSRNVRIKKSSIKGDFVYITASKEDAEEILKLNTFTFAGVPLAITESAEGMPAPGPPALSSSALEIKDQLRSVLSQRYDVNGKLLNLSLLGEDAGLNQMGLFNGESRPEKLFRALMAVCEGLFKTAQEKRDAIVSISLAGNNIDDVLQIMSLTDTFPDVVNLDLSRNQFKNIKGLQKWRHRLRNCETLLLNENPIETLEPNYKAEVTKWFPKLQNLSGLQVRTPEQVAAEEAASRPTPIPQSGADFRDINRVGECFVTEFIQLYDSDRDNLAAKYYDDQSTFSVSVNTKLPFAPDVPPASWSAYIKQSRNHTRITQPSARQQRLFIGTSIIQSAWRNLPPTRHPDLIAQFDKYTIDCHPISGLADPTGQSPIGVDGMIITMHGEFEDQEPGTMKTAKRSFSRTFVLGPGAPGRNAIRVISDLLSVKAFNYLPSSTPAPGPAPAVQPNEELQKQQMIVELGKQTGMNAEYSKYCLEGANWNFDQALVSFNEKKAELPPAAFVAAPI
ncbi:hypothetical protein F4780DRAFT_119360 [Xylariomycetidae sp. FL0641]|nr:hypothetical protein F4780DRAFT_119360 [Xylariomycetidae sp. FL0641]